jgi:hypothetical protein
MDYLITGRRFSVQLFSTAFQHTQLVSNNLRSIENEMEKCREMLMNGHHHKVYDLYPYDLSLCPHVRSQIDWIVIFPPFVGVSTALIVVPTNLSLTIYVGPNEFRTYVLQNLKTS